MVNIQTFPGLQQKEEPFVCTDLYNESSMIVLNMTCCESDMVYCLYNRNLQFFIFLQKISHTQLRNSKLIDFCLSNASQWFLLLSFFLLFLFDSPIWLKRGKLSLKNKKIYNSKGYFLSRLVKMSVTKQKCELLLNSLTTNLTSCLSLNLP